MKQVDVGFLLKRIPYSESSFVVNYFTLNHGIQSFLYQGGKKKGIALFPMAMHELTFYKRPDSELGKISQLAIDESYVNLPYDPIKSIVAYFIAEVLKQCVQTDQPEQTLFDYIKTKLKQLDATIQLENFPLIFLVEFSFYIGINPLVHSEENLSFNLNEGEFNNDENSFDIIYKDDATDLLLAILENRVVSTTKATNSLALNYMVQYYEMHIPKCNLTKPLTLLKEILYD